MEPTARLFSFKDLIAGNGFIALVSMDGRVVQGEYGSDFEWLYGVQPGGISGGTEGDFKIGYLSVLCDIAAEARSFEEFSAEVRKFFEQVNEPESRIWKEELRVLRGIAGQDAEDASNQPSLTVARVVPELATSMYNQFGTFSDAV